MSNVKLVGITQPLIYDPSIDRNLTADEFIAYVARVSNPSNQMNHQTAENLIRYCIKKNHWSVFETVNIIVEIETTRDIGRQILRHRSFSFQEFSQRYADPTKELGFVNREARLQDVRNRQNSIDTDDETIISTWETLQGNIIQHAQATYKWAIENGVAKEQARVVLPEGLITTRMYMNGTLRSWITYCQLRMGAETQKEHREVATQAWNEIIKVLPTIGRALDSENQK